MKKIGTSPPAEAILDQVTWIDNIMKNDAELRNYYLTTSGDDWITYSPEEKKNNVSDFWAVISYSKYWSKYASKPVLDASK